METFKFTIHSLLYKSGDHVTGAMSPVLFAKEMAKSLEMKYNRLARIWFNDEKIHQQYEDGGLTGHDTLIIACKYSNDFFVSIWVDEGLGGMPVASALESDREITLTQPYENATYARKLTPAEIRAIMEHVFDHPDEIAIIEEEAGK